MPCPQSSPGGVDGSRPIPRSLLDQNLHNDTLGTELAARLKRSGFRGVCCILTGASQEEIGRISSMSGVDCAMPKTTSAKMLAERCLTALAAKRQPAHR